jgi:hypothetical protein
VRDKFTHVSRGFAFVHFYSVGTSYAYCSSNCYAYFCSLFSFFFLCLLFEYTLSVWVDIIDLFDGKFDLICI